jgi:predicted transcriptional regulator
MMQRNSKTLRVEMLLLDDDCWGNNATARHSNGARSKAAICDNKQLSVQCDGTSLDGFSRLLSKRNIQLLKLIKEAAPQSVAELARLSGRPKASLMLTLRRFKNFGIVEFDEKDGRRKVPRLACDRLRLEIPIG